jgi:hypothetical protein
MRVDVTAGAGWLYDAAVPSPQHPLEVIMMREDDVSAALNDGDGTHPRIDVISVTPSSALLDTEPVLQIGGGTTNVPIRRGPDYAINVTEGTPAASPVAPSTPSGAMKLAEVLVPAGLTAGGGGTSAATITDYRNRAGLEVKGPESPLNGWVQHFDDWTPAGVATLLQAFGVRDADGKVMAYGVDRVNHWPAIFRAGVPTGDDSANLYPMTTSGDREHLLSTPFNAGDPDTADASVTIQGFGAAQYGGVVITHLTGNAVTRRASAVFLTPARGASFDDYKLKYEVLTAAPSTLDARAVAYDASADAIVNLSDTTNLTKTVGTHEETLDNPVEFTPDDGDIVGIRIEIGFAAAADSAAIECRTGSATVREGRA